MALLITYDLNKTKDYDRLIDAIQAIGPSLHLLKSAWVVVTTLSAARVGEYLEDYVDADDDVFIVEITGQPASWSDSFSEHDTIWLKQNLGK